MVPFKFNDSTNDMLEKLNYIKDNINENRQNDVNKIVFYNIPDIDVNLDNIPDQWELSGNGDAELSYEDNKIIAEAKNGALSSRKLKLKPNTQYRIKLKMDNLTQQTPISYNLDGITAKAEEFKTDKDILSAVITSPQGSKEFESALKININGKCEISGVLIEEI